MFIARTRTGLAHSVMSAMFIARTRTDLAHSVRSAMLIDVPQNKALIVEFEDVLLLELYFELP